MDKYKDIINLSHYEPHHKRMEIADRAAIFGAFQALTGFKESIVETGRITDSKLELSEEKREILNNKLNIINNHLKEKLNVKLTYFIKDDKKEGGVYITKDVIIKKIKKDLLITDTNLQIKFEDIYDIKMDDEIIEF